MNLYILVVVICIGVSYGRKTYSWKLLPEEDIKDFAKKPVTESQQDGLFSLYYKDLLKFVLKVRANNPLEVFPREIKINKFKLQDFDLEVFILKASFYSHVLDTAASSIDKRIVYLYKKEEHMATLTDISGDFATANTHLDMTADEIIKEMEDLTACQSHEKCDKFVKDLKKTIEDATFVKTAEQGIKKLLKLMGKEDPAESDERILSSSQSKLTKLSLSFNKQANNLTKNLRRAVTF